MILSKLMSNDALFIFLFIAGSAVGVVFIVTLLFDLIVWALSPFRRKPKQQQQGWPPPPMPALSATFDQLDALVAELARKLA